MTKASFVSVGGIVLTAIGLAAAAQEPRPEEPAGGIRPDLRKLAIASSPSSGR